MRNRKARRRVSGSVASVGLGEVAVDGEARGDGRHHGDQEGDAERAEIADRADREAAEQRRDLVAVSAVAMAGAMTKPRSGEEERGGGRADQAAA